MSCIAESYKHAKSVVEELERDHLLIMSDLTKAFEEGLIEESYMLKRSLEFEQVLQSYRDYCVEVDAWSAQIFDSDYYSSSEYGGEYDYYDREEVYDRDRFD